MAVARPIPVAAPVTSARLPACLGSTARHDIAPAPSRRRMRHPLGYGASAGRPRRTEREPVAEYRTDSLPDACVIEASGEIDISNVAELTRRVLEALAKGTTAIAIDLCHVTHLDSSGLAALISAQQQVTDVPGGKLAVVLDAKRLRRIFELRGLDRVFLIT